VYAIRTSKRLRIRSQGAARDERLVGLHVNDCTMFTLDVAHIGGDFPLERRSISIRHGFVKERERYKLLNIGAFHAARFPDTSRLREIILQHPGCHRRKGRENSGQITSKLRSEWRKSFRNCIRASRKNGRKDACCDCDTPGQTEISVVSLRSSLVPNSIGSHIAIQVLGHSLGLDTVRSTCSSCDSCRSAILRSESC
jgi:hypothetical protein